VKGEPGIAVRRGAVAPGEREPGAAVESGAVVMKQAPGISPENGPTAGEPGRSADAGMATLSIRPGVSLLPEDI